MFTRTAAEHDERERHEHVGQQRNTGQQLDQEDHDDEVRLNVAAMELSANGDTGVAPDEMQEASWLQRR